MEFIDRSAAAPGFTLVCPGYRAASSHAGASAGEGRLAFTIGSQLVAEMDYADLLESWAATEQLSAAEREVLSEAAATQLMELLEEGLETADLTGAVTDAAVVFLLAMKRHGISDPKRIPACSVMWTLTDARERVIFSA